MPRPSVHEIPGGGQNYLQPDDTLGFDNLMTWHTFGQPIGTMAATVSVTAGGVLLAVQLAEPDGCGMAPLGRQARDPAFHCWMTLPVVAPPCLTGRG